MDNYNFAKNWINIEKDLLFKFYKTHKSEINKFLKTGERDIEVEKFALKRMQSYQNNVLKVAEYGRSMQKLPETERDFNVVEYERYMSLFILKCAKRYYDRTSNKARDWKLNKNQYIKLLNNKLNF